MGQVIGLFSGQGAQYVGMGQELYKEFSTVRTVYECGSDILGYDLAKVSFQGDEEALAQTKIAQPAIFALSVAAYKAALKVMPMPKGVAGHSLGEFAALFASGVYGLEEGFRVIKARGEAMDSVKATGSMTAVLRTSEGAVVKACQEVEGLVLPANINLPDQIVIAGERDAVREVEEILKGEGARVRPLKVANGFHTPLMEEGAKRFKAAVESFSFKEPQKTFFSNITGNIFEFTPLYPDFPSYFYQHIISGVEFVKEMDSMEEWGATKVVEFGPKKTLVNLVKKYKKELEVFNVEDIKSLKELEDAFNQRDAGHTPDKRSR